MTDNFQSLNNIGATRDNAYWQPKLGDNSFDGQNEAGEAIRSTYSLLKRDPSYAWNGEGTSPNVTNAILSSMNKPLEINGKIFFENTPVGIQHPFDEFGDRKYGYSTYNMIC